MKIFIVGLGLIGASYAEKLTHAAHTVYGSDRSEKTVKHALEAGVIQGGNLDDIALCDLIVLALYPEANVRFITENKHRFVSGQVLTDVSGVKDKMVSTIEGVLPQGVSYVSHHPMAGSEKSGFDARNAALFEGKTAILIATAQTDKNATALLRGVLKTIGFSSIITSTVRQHDAMIAHTSQLPHALALSLVAIGEDNTLRFAANSYRDLTRIASINAPMWRELFLNNKNNLCGEIDKMMAELKKIKTLLETNDARGIEFYMKAVSEKRDAYGNHQDQ